MGEVWVGRELWEQGKVNSALGMIKRNCVPLPALDVGSVTFFSSTFAVGFKAPERLCLTCSRDWSETCDLATRPLGTELAAAADGGKDDFLVEEAMSVFLQRKYGSGKSGGLRSRARGAYVFTRYCGDVQKN